MPRHELRTVSYAARKNGVHAGLAELPQMRWLTDLIELLPQANISLPLLLVPLLLLFLIHLLLDLRSLHQHDTEE